MTWSLRLHNSPAVRGGLLLLAVSCVSILAGGAGNRSLFIFVWMACAWIAFPVGAFMGGWVSERILSRSWPAMGLYALIAGCLAGLTLALGFFLFLKSNEIIGLIKNAGGGGYESYRFSVLKGFQELAWNLSKSVVPITTAAYVTWTLKQRKNQTSGPPLKTDPEAMVTLELSSKHLTSWAIIAVSVGTVTSAFLLIIGGLSKTLFLGSLGGIVVTILGPWLGPLINPAGGSHFGHTLGWICLPIMLLTLLPFLLKLKVSRAGASVCWCLYWTGILFWLSMGLISAGYSMG